MKTLPPLIALVGATAAGKTEFAVALAQRVGAEIISADSRLFYRGMDIGTAKPSPAERGGIPHHLIDTLAPDQPYSLAQFQQDVYALVDAICQRERLPLMVGGTGQYVRAVTEGWTIPAQAADPRLRDMLEQWGAELGSEGLHTRLAILDPEAARQIEPRNLRRTVRALEVTLRTGQPFSAQSRGAAARVRPLLIGLARPRQELYARIDARIEEMFRRGLLAEAEALLARGYSRELPALSAIGYAQAAGVLAGEYDLEEAKRLTRRKTREFVRRQANWFKPGDPAIHWLAPDAAGLAQAERLIEEFIARDG
jgi:tRNA dimethylallyltransferase